MYRHYEDPFFIEKLLREAETDFQNAEEKGEDIDTLYELFQTVEDLKARLRYAWDDQEYDMYA